MTFSTALSPLAPRHGAAHPIWFLDRTPMPSGLLAIAKLRTAQTNCGITANMPAVRRGK